MDIIMQNSVDKKDAKSISIGDVYQEVSKTVPIGVTVGNEVNTDLILEASRERYGGIVSANKSQINNQVYQNSNEKFMFSEKRQS